MTSMIQLTGSNVIYWAAEGTQSFKTYRDTDMATVFSEQTQELSLGSNQYIP